MAVYPGVNGGGDRGRSGSRPGAGPVKVNRLVLENAEGGRVLVDARAGRASSRKRGRACVVVVYPGVNWRAGRCWPR